MLEAPEWQINEIIMNSHTHNNGKQIASEVHVIVIRS